MLGTSSRDLPGNTPGGELGELISAMQMEESKETRMLLQLAAISLLKRSTPGLLRFNQSLPEPCPAENRKYAPVAAISLLNQLLDDLSNNGLRLIERWLSLCAHHGRLIPDYLLPVVLDKLKNKKAPVTLIDLCGGNRLKFLIDANEDWKVFDMMAHKSESTLVEKIDSGTKEERLASFLQLRHIEPMRAIASIAPNFSKESVDMRVNFLKRMEPPQTSDMTFLEQLINTDKSREVRVLASEMLTLLPGSSVIETLHSQLTEVMTVSKGQLKINLSDESIEARDKAIEDLELYLDTSTQTQTPGKKSDYLRKLLGSINPDHLSAAYDSDPQELLKLFEQEELWSQPLLDGLLEAVRFFGNRGKCKTVTEWQTQIVARMGEKLTDSQAGLKLFQSLPPSLLETILLDKLPKWSQEGATVAPKLDFWYQLDKVQFDWSEAFTQKVIEFIVKEAKEKVPALDYTFRASVNNFALDMHISAVNRIDEIASIRRDSEQTDFFARPLNQLVDILSLRRDIEAAFTE
ncbi:MAG: hypothetical protein IPL73_20165 [Candidatus Obscuribacter sp.]|nr:hypothetical protein [Candidatus Obscuribacter sp.]